MAFEPSFLILAAALVSGVAMVARVWGRKARWWRRLRKLPTTRIADARPGLVKLIGTLRRIDPPLHAPLTGRACIGYEVEIIANDDDQKRLRHEADCTSSLLDDGSGVALVRAAHTTLIAKVDTTILLGGMQAADPRAVAYLDAQRIERKGLFFDLSRKCTEGILEEGELVVVCGHGRIEADPDPAKVDQYRDLPTRFVMYGEETSPMLVSDDPMLVDLGRRAR